MTVSSGETENEVMTDVNHSEKLPQESFESQGQVSTQKTVSFLTLGDGDFTYSLDLVRFLASTKTDIKYVVTASGVDTCEELMSKYKDAPFVLKQLANTASASHNSCSETHDKLAVHIRHGINAIVMPTILVEGKEGDRHENDKCSGSHNSNSPITPESPGSLSPPSNDALNSPAVQPADHVMFHHPHLATEDAVLHQKFLCHLFHTVNHSWLAPCAKESDTVCDNNNMEHTGTGFFHLTLVKGQAERWKCLETAGDQGFQLVWRGPFVPPPPPLHPKLQATTNDGEIPLATTYQLRRHQTGKSFASRRPEWQSESLIFQRRQEGRKKKGSIQNSSILPWDIIKAKEEEEPTITESLETLENVKAKNSHHEGFLLACPHCDKVFREERSLKCHEKAKHASLLPQEDNDGDNERRKKKTKTKRKRELVSLESLPTTVTGGTTNPWHCPHQCKGIDGGLRTFCSQEALQSHIVAKHSGLHQSISPDWKQESLESSPSTTTTKRLPATPPTRDDQPKEMYYGRCRICGWNFETKADALQHIHDFTPPSTVLSFSCRFCNKVFREKRAQLQHENFCSHRNKNMQG